MSLFWHYFHCPFKFATADGKSNLRFSEIEHFPSNEVHNSNALPFHFAFQAIQTIHPIIIAGLMLFLVLGACFFNDRRKRDRTLSQDRLPTAKNRHPELARAKLIRFSTPSAIYNVLYQTVVHCLASTQFSISQPYSIENSDLPISTFSIRESNCLNTLA